EFVGEEASADRRLEVESADRDLRGDGAAVRDQLVVCGIGECGEAEQAEIVAGGVRELCLGESLGRAAADARDFQHAAARDALVIAQEVEGEAEGGLEERAFGIANGERRGVHADGDTAPAGLAVVTGERSLTALIELAVSGEGEWVRGDDHQNFPSETSKCVGLLSDAPPASIHSATISIRRCELTVGAPIRSWHVRASLRRALGPSAPVNCAGLPKRSAK